jgi:hypothetical protein
MGRVEQYNIHTHIVNEYKILPVPMGMKLNYNHTRWVEQIYKSYLLF